MLVGHYLRRHRPRGCRLPRRHGSSKRRSQDRRNRDRQHSRPGPVEVDCKPDYERDYRESQALVSEHLQAVVAMGYEADPRDVAASWLGMIQ